jgi:hypothetical protein
MSGKIVITISKTGEVRREAFGFKGESCLKESKFLDDLFGKPDKEELKESFYETEEDKLIDGLPSGWCG